MHVLNYSSMHKLKKRIHRSVTIHVSFGFTVELFSNEQNQSSVRDTDSGHRTLLLQNREFLHGFIGRVLVDSLRTSAELEEKISSFKAEVKIVIDK